MATNQFGGAGATGAFGPDKAFTPIYDKNGKLVGGDNAISQQSVVLPKVTQSVAPTPTAPIAKPTSVTPVGGVSVPNNTNTSTQPKAKTQAELDAEFNAGALEAPNAMIGTGLSQGDKDLNAGALAGGDPTSNVNADVTGNGQARFIDGKQVDEATYQSWLNTQNTNLTNTERNIDAATSKIVDETQSRIKGQEAVFDDAQLGQRNMNAELVSNLENYRKEYEKQNISNRLLGQEQLEKQLASATAAMDAELAKSGVINYDTSAMNHDTRMKYNAFQAKSAGIKAQQELLNGNLSVASDIINDYYNNQQQYLRDRANNYNNILSGASDELGRLDNKEKEFVGLQLANLEGEISNERKKQETIETYKNDKDTMARAMKAGLKLTDDPDTMMSYLSSAAKEQETINDLSKTFMRSTILPGDTMEQVKEKLKLDPDFITQFGKNVDVVTNSKNGAIYAYNKVTGKYTPIVEGLSNEELSKLDIKDIVTLELQYKKDFDNNVQNFKQTARNVSAIEDAYNEIANNPNGPLSAANQTLITSFNKILDPASVVREGEYDRTIEGQALLNKLKSMVASPEKGFVLQPQEAKKYLELAKNITKRDAKQFMSSANLLVEQINGVGGNINRVLGGEDINTLNVVASDTLEEAAVTNPELFKQVIESFPDLTDYEQLQLIQRAAMGGFNLVGNDTESVTNPEVIKDVSNATSFNKNGLQCGEFVNQTVGMTVGNTWKDKVNNVNKFGTKGYSGVSVGDVIYQNTGTPYGHVAVVTGKDNNGNLIVSESNWNKDEKVTHNRVVKPTQVYGYIKPTQAKSLAINKSNIS